MANGLSPLMATEQARRGGLNPGVPAVRNVGDLLDEMLSQVRGLPSLMPQQQQQIPTTGPGMPGLPGSVGPQQPGGLTTGQQDALLTGAQTVMNQLMARELIEAQPPSLFQPRNPFAGVSVPQAFGALGFQAAAPQFQPFRQL